MRSPTKLSYVALQNLATYLIGIVLSTIFLSTIIFTDEEFLPTSILPTFFYKRDHLVFLNLKMPLVYLFDFKFD